MEDDVQDMDLLDHPIEKTTDDLFAPPEEIAEGDPIPPDSMLHPVARRRQSIPTGKKVVYPKRGDLLEPEYGPFYDAWRKQATPQTSGALLSQIKPILDAGLRSYGDPRNPVLRSRARQMALDALARYDPSKAKLKTYLLTQLQGLRRLRAKQEQVIPLPEQILLDQHYLYESEQHLRDELGRDPDDTELADSTGLSLRRIAHIRKASGGIPEGSLLSPSEEGEIEVFRPQAALPGQHDEEDAWMEFVYQSLSPVDRLVMEHSLGLRGKRKLSGLALAKRLRISPAAVSQRRSKIQQLLNERGDLQIF